MPLKVPTGQNSFKKVGGWMTLSMSVTGFPVNLGFFLAKIVSISMLLRILTVAMTRDIL